KIQIKARYGPRFGNRKEVEGAMQLGNRHRSLIRQVVRNQVVLGLSPPLVAAVRLFVDEVTRLPEVSARRAICLSLDKDGGTLRQRLDRWFRSNLPRLSHGSILKKQCGLEQFLTRRKQ